MTSETTDTQASFPPPLEPEVRARVLEQALEFKLARKGCLLGTFRPDGYPRFSRMGCPNNGWKLYMSTIKRPDKRKIADVQSNRRVTVLYTDPTIRPDHFLQIDGVAIDVTGDALAEWQKRRFETWPHEIQQYDAHQNEWIGWIVEPIRVRVLGHLPRGTQYWSEAPVLFRRHELGLPPLSKLIQPQPAHWPLFVTEHSYRVPDLDEEVAFWEDAFGLERVSPRPGQPLQQWASFDVGGCRLQFARGGSVRPVPQSKADIHGEPSFHVTDIENHVTRALVAGATAVTELRTLGSDQEPPVHKFIFMVSPGGVPFGLVDGDEATYRKRLGMRPSRYW